MYLDSATPPEPYPKSAPKRKTGSPTPPRADGGSLRFPSCRSETPTTSIEASIESVDRRHRWPHPIAEMPYRRDTHRHIGDESARQPSEETIWRGRQSKTPRIRSERYDRRHPTIGDTHGDDRGTDERGHPFTGRSATPLERIGGTHRPCRPSTLPSPPVPGTFGATIGAPLGRDPLAPGSDVTIRDIHERNNRRPCSRERLSERYPRGIRDTHHLGTCWQIAPRRLHSLDGDRPVRFASPLEIERRRNAGPSPVGAAARAC